MTDLDLEVLPGTNAETTFFNEQRTYVYCSRLCFYCRAASGVVCIILFLTCTKDVGSVTIDQEQYIET